MEEKLKQLTREVRNIQMTKEEYEATRAQLLRRIHTKPRELEREERISSPYARKMLLIFQRSVVVVLILALSFNLSKPVAAKSLPGDLLYPIKIIHEEIEIAQIRNPKEKAKHQIERTKKRIAEIEILKKKHKLDKKKEEVVAEKIKEHVEKVHEVIEEMKEEEPSNALELNTELVSTLKASVEILQDDKGESSEGDESGENVEGEEVSEEKGRDTDNSPEPSIEVEAENESEQGEEEVQEVQDTDELDERTVNGVTGEETEEETSKNDQEISNEEESEVSAGEETEVDETEIEEHATAGEIVDTPDGIAGDTTRENLEKLKNVETAEVDKKAESENPLLLNILQVEVEKANAVKDDLKEQIVREYNEAQMEVSDTHSTQQSTQHEETQQNESEEQKEETVVGAAGIRGEDQTETTTQTQNEITPEKTEQEEDISTETPFPALEDLQKDASEEVVDTPSMAENKQNPVTGEALEEVKMKIEEVTKLLNEYHTKMGIGEDPLITVKRKLLEQEHRYGELLILLQEELEKFKTLENMEMLKERHKREV